MNIFYIVKLKNACACTCILKSMEKVAEWINFFLVIDMFIIHLCVVVLSKRTQHLIDAVGYLCKLTIHNIHMYPFYKVNKRDLTLYCVLFFLVTSYRSPKVCVACDFVRVDVLFKHFEFCSCHVVCIIVLYFGDWTQLSSVALT